ncbi:MAG TPA: hypothetical protein VIL99_09485 [Ignavibacteria bacterium]
MKKIIFLFVLFLSFESVLSQTIIIGGTVFKFGASISSVSKCCPEDNGIESNYSYITAIECNKCGSSSQVTSIEFYENKLVLMEIFAVESTDNPYPMCKEIEKIIEGYDPFKKLNEDNGLTLAEVFKTDTYYVRKATTDMFARYFIIPVKSLDEIWAAHPEYYEDYFKE